LVARHRPVAFSPARPSRIPLILLSSTAIVAASVTVWGVITVWGRLPEPSAYPKMWASFHAARWTGLAATVFVVVLLVTVLLVLMGRADLDGRRPDVVCRSDVSNPAAVEGARPLAPGEPVRRAPLAGGFTAGPVTPTGPGRSLGMGRWLWQARRPRPAGAASK
jgi:hypothetical protein